MRWRTSLPWSDPGDRRAARRGGTLVLVAVALAQIAVALDYYALTVALPDMARDFGVRTTDLQWVISAYLLAFASFLVIGGRLGDVYGRRRLLLIGVVIFGLASVACGLAPDQDLLVAFRAVQGFGAAMLFPASLAALAAAFDQDRRSWAIGVVLGVSTLGDAVGPFLGGALTDLLSWRWVFFINAPITVAAVVMALVALQETRDEAASRQLDVAGCLTLAGGLVALTLAIDRANEAPVWVPLALGVLAVGLLAAFVAVEQRAAAPLIRLSLFGDRPFRNLLAAGCLGNYGWALGVFTVTLYLQVVRGLSPFEAGAVFILMSVGTAAGAPLAGWLVARASAGSTMVGGLVLGGGGLLWLSFDGSWASFLTALLVTGLGVGLAYSTANIATVAIAPPEETGAAEGATLTALVIFAAVAVTTAGMLIEVLSGGSEDRATAGAVADVLRVGAAVTLLGALILVVAAVRDGRRRRASGVDPAAARD